ncbi:MAG: hypothetical protein GEU82_05740 [Luteitalea sp.]|nr:hypothetical protein [Luteitalea sp.]
MPRLAAPALDVSVLVNAPADAAFRAFFDHDALGRWWQVVRSVATPRTLGAFALEWTPTEYRDDRLGRLGGVFRGTVMHADEGHGFFVADAYWLPPDGEPIGPMALEVSFAPEHGPDGEVRTRVRVEQNGFEESVRWRRYYEVLGIGWERALQSLKVLLELT